MGKPILANKIQGSHRICQDTAGLVLNCILKGKLLIFSATVLKDINAVNLP